MLDSCLPDANTYILRLCIDCNKNVLFSLCAHTRATHSVHCLMLALDCFDYPRNFDENILKHPLDYTTMPTPIQPQFIVHARAGRRRLIFRASWKIDTGSYMPMSFIVDTGSAKPLYLSE